VFRLFFNYKTKQNEKKMANFCPGILYSIVWLILLFLVFPIFGFLGFLYCLCLVLQPCIPPLKDISTTLLKWIQWLERIGTNIKTMHPLKCD